MLERHNQCMAKLDDILEHIINKINALPNQPPNITPAIKAQSISAYSGFVASLKQGMQSYANNTFKKSEQLKTIIMGMLQNSILAHYTCDNLTLRPVTGTFFGYDDLRKLYSCDGIYSSILTPPLDSFYNGLVTDEMLSGSDSGSDNAFPPGTFVLNDLITKAARAEQSEQATRTSLINWLNSASAFNVFMLLFESPANGRVGMTARDLASDLYLGNHARDIIYEFNLDVYIPIALRI